MEICKCARRTCTAAGMILILLVVLSDFMQARQLTAWALEQRRLDEGRPDKHVANVIDDHTLAGPAVTGSLDVASSTIKTHSSNHRKNSERWTESKQPAHWTGFRVPHLL
jgi:hypothetical protein